MHDELAYYCMGGVSGHAGLFSNASDLARLASVMLTGGYENNRFFSIDVMDTFTSPKNENEANWGLGWWRKGDRNDRSGNLRLCRRYARFDALIIRSSGCIFFRFLIEDINLSK